MNIMYTLCSHVHHVVSTFTSTSGTHYVNMYIMYPLGMDVQYMHVCIFVHSMYLFMYTMYA